MLSNCKKIYICGEHALSNYGKLNAVFVKIENPKKHGRAGVDYSDTIRPTITLSFLDVDATDWLRTQLAQSPPQFNAPYNTLIFQGQQASLLWLFLADHDAENIVISSPNDFSRSLSIAIAVCDAIKKSRMILQGAIDSNINAVPPNRYVYDLILKAYSNGH